MKWIVKVSTTRICGIAFTIAVLLNFFTPIKSWHDVVFWGLGLGTIFGVTWSNKK